MAKDSDPFGSEPPSTDPFGRPIAGRGEASDWPAPVDEPQPTSAAQTWPAGPAPPPSGEHALAPAPARRADGAIAALILGIIGLFFCQILAPVAWSLGRKAERLVDASGGTLGGRGEATTGKILGIVGTVLLILGIVVVILLVVIGLSIGSDAVTTTTTFEL